MFDTLGHSVKTEVNIEPMDTKTSMFDTLGNSEETEVKIERTDTEPSGSEWPPRLESNSCSKRRRENYDRNCYSKYRRENNKLFWPGSEDEAPNHHLELQHNLNTENTYPKAVLKLLQASVALQSSDNWFKCGNCNLCFENETSLTQHQLQAGGDCKETEKMVRPKDKFHGTENSVGPFLEITDEVLRTHPFQCVLCKTMHETARKLYQHLLRDHQRYTCLVCKACFNNIDHAASHVKKSHSQVLAKKRGAFSKKTAAAEKIKPTAEEINPIAEETDSVADKTVPVADVTDSIAEETDSVLELTNSVAKETDPGAKEKYSVAKETDPVSEETDPLADKTDVAEKTDPVADKTAVAEKTDPVAEETVTAAEDLDDEKTDSFDEETDSVIVETDFVDIGADSVADETDSDAEETDSDAEEPDPLAEEANAVDEETDSDAEEQVPFAKETNPRTTHTRIDMGKPVNIDKINEEDLDKPWKCSLCDYFRWTTVPKSHKRVHMEQEARREAMREALRKRSKAKKTEDTDVVLEVKNPGSTHIDMGKPAIIDKTNEEDLDKPWKCSLCDYFRWTKVPDSYLARHERIHREHEARREAMREALRKRSETMKTGDTDVVLDVNYECHHCNEIFKRKDEIRLHIESGRCDDRLLTNKPGSSDSEPLAKFHCLPCNLTFEDPQSIRAHNKILHVQKAPQIDTKKYTCKMCDTSFDCQDVMNAHTLIKHVFAHNLNKKDEDENQNNVNEQRTDMLNRNINDKIVQNLGNFNPEQKADISNRAMINKKFEHFQCVKTSDINKLYKKIKKNVGRIIPTHEDDKKSNVKFKDTDDKLRYRKTKSEKNPRNIRKIVNIKNAVIKFDKNILKRVKPNIAEVNSKALTTAELKMKEILKKYKSTQVKKAVKKKKIHRVSNKTGSYHCVPCNLEFENSYSIWSHNKNVHYQKVIRLKKNSTLCRCLNCLQYDKTDIKRFYCKFNPLNYFDLVNAKAKNKERSEKLDEILRKGNGANKYDLHDDSDIVRVSENARNKRKVELSDCSIVNKRMKGHECNYLPRISQKVENTNEI